MTRLTPEKTPNSDTKVASPEEGWRFTDAFRIRRIGASARRVFSRGNRPNTKEAAREYYHQQALREIGVGVQTTIVRRHR